MGLATNVPPAGACWSEAERLAALERYRVLDTERERAFDDIAELAADIFGAPIAVVNFIAEGRQWFKAEVGIGQREMSLDVSICRHAMLHSDVLVVPDLTIDERFTSNPLVTADGGLRFYAGAALKTSEGLPLGTVCVLDNVARPNGVTERQMRTLQTLASQTMAQLELRRSEAALRASEARLQFLDSLTEAAQPLKEPAAVMTTIARLLGEHLNLSVCAYADMDPDQNGFTIRGDWAAPGAFSIVGRYILADFGKLAVAKLSAGLPLVINDNLRELAPEEAATFQSIGIAATICMPLVKEGRLTALMAAHDRAPRHWSPEELALVSDTTERSWAHIERIRSEAALERRSRQMQSLADVATAAARAQTLETTLDEITHAARRIVGAHQAVVSLTRGADWRQAINTVALTEKYRDWRDYASLPDGSGIYAWLCEQNRPARLTQAELEAHPRWRGFGEHADDHSPMRGWLAAPLVGRDGRNLGLIQLSDKEDGLEFDEADEAILVQLAQLASAAVEQAQTEASLATKASEFEALAENVSQLAWMANADGHIYWYNKRWYEYTGTDLEGMLGWGWREVHHPDHVDRVIAEVQAHWAAGEAWEGVYLLRGQDGVFRPFLTRAEPIRGLDGELLRWFGTNTDISAQVAADEAVRASEARLRAVVDAAPVGLVFADASGQITGGNARVEAILGHPVLPSTSVEQYRDWVGFHADGRRVEGREYPLARALAGEEHPELEVLYERGDGRKAWIRFIAAAKHDGEGRIIGGVVASLDIDAERRAEAELRRLNETLESRVDEALNERKLWADVFETTDAKIAAIGLDRTFLALNGAYADEFEKIFGVRPKLGDHLSVLLAHLPEQQAAALAVWDRALNGERFTVTEEFGDPNRVRPYYELRFNPLHDRQGVMVGAFQYAVDVTDRLRAQADLVQAQTALRQSQKMDSLGQMVGGIAHDFNNLLTGIIGALDLLERRVSIGRTENLERYTTTALASAKRAAALTQRLLAFSRRQSLDPKPTDLNLIVRSMEDLVRRSVGEAVTVETALAGGLWTTKIDRSEIENGLLNLCINARDAMPEGGRLTIETSNGHLDDAYAARHPDVRPGQYAVLSVTDTGVGMTADVVERIFEPFWTTKPIGKGTGLGLSQLFGFVKQSDGHVAVYSEVGQGTTFKVYLPRHRGAAVEDAVEDAAELPRAEDQEAVLVVEDEDTVRMLVLDVLQDLGYEAHEAVDAQGALRILESDARIDLLVTDVGLPGLNGRQLADRARELRPGLKVLFITGYAHNAAIGNGLLEPGMEVVTKPFAVDRLATKIASMVSPAS